MDGPDLTDALTGARSLLGWKLIHRSPEGVTSGYIIETEAYDMHDPASHAFGGRRQRNAAMYAEAGTVYVYFSYGLHFCMNIVTGDEGHGQGVLIRALEPLEGIDLMMRRRGKTNKLHLTNGPAKLTQAMGVDLAQRGSKLGKGSLYLEPGLEVGEVIQTTRIGISKAKDRLWRFYIPGNIYVSRR